MKKFVLLTIVLFCYMVEFTLFPGLTTRRLSVIVAIIYIIIHRNEFSVIWKMNIRKRKIKFFSILMFLMILLNLVVVIGAPFYNNAKYLEWYLYIHYFTNVLLFGFFCVLAFGSAKKFILSWTLLMVLQSVVVLISLNSPTLRYFIYENLYTGDDRMEKAVEFGSRLMGIGIHSATGSVVMASACIMLVYLKLRDQINTIIFLLLYVLIVMGTIFMGRTGMLVELVVLLAYFFTNGSVKRNLLIGMGVLVIGVYLLTWLKDSVSEGVYNWITLSAENSNFEATMEGLGKSGWPPINTELIFGSGIFRGYRYQGVIYENDSGYMSMYTAVGIVGSLIFYIGLYYLMSSPKYYSCKKTNIMLIGVMIIAYVIEYKESFFWAYILTWTIFTLRLFESYEKTMLKIEYE